MENYICKIASLDEIIEKADYEINRHPGNDMWVLFKEYAIKGFENKSKITYIGVLDGEIICEATAVINEVGFEGDIENYEHLPPKDETSKSQEEIINYYYKIM